MLQRAAIDAYSWWWASHTRTKQSKLLEQDMHDMEEKVEYILKIINEEGDSFAVRAEMYYRKRPELVNFVEDCFRNYRALAERYDHLSRELQSANRTIATVFPERVQMAIEEFDDETFSAASSNFFSESKQPSEKLPAAPPKLSIPRIVSIIKRNSKAPSRMMSRKGLLKMNSVDDLMADKSSGLTKEEALREIDKLQKDILGLQTEKEFVKSSMESAMTKCCNIEKQVTEMQARVSSLEDEFGISTVIEDDEARSLMASTALKSCKETLVKLQAKQEQMADEARLEHWRIKEAREKSEALTGRVCTNQTLPKEDKSLNPCPVPNNQMVAREPNSPNPIPGPNNQTLPKEHKSPNPSPGPSNEMVPSEHKSPHPSQSNQTVPEHKSTNPSPGSSNQTVPSEHKSSNPSPGPSNQTVPSEHESSNPNLGSSNQTVPKHESSNPSPGPSNQTVPKHESSNPSPGPSNQTVPEQESSNPSPSPSNQRVPSEHKSSNPSPSPSNQRVPSEHKSSNPSPSPSNQRVPSEHESSNPNLGSSKQTVPKHESPNPSLGPSNQTVPNKHESANPSPGLSPDFEETVGKETNGMEILRAKIKDRLLANGETGPTVSELVENIDELVDKVINLETEVNSQSALVKRLRSAANQLEAHISILKEGKEGLFGDSEKKSKKISELEEELCRVQSLDDAVINQNKNLKARVNEASCNLDLLSEKLPNAKPDEEGETKILFKEERAVPGVNLEKRIQACEDRVAPNNALGISKGVKTNHRDDLPQKGKVRAVLDGVQEQRFKESEHTIGNDYDLLTFGGTGIKEEMKKDRFAGQRASAKSQLNGHLVQGEARAALGSKKKGDEEKGIEEKEKNEHHVHQNQSDQQDDLSAKNRESKNQDSFNKVGRDEEDQPNWRELFLNGLDDRERTLVEEYTSLLGNYKQVKKKLSEVENRNRASQFKSIVQIKVLKSANAAKDEEIKALHTKLSLFITSPDENPNTQESTSTTSPEESPNTRESKSTTSTDENLNTRESTSVTSTDETPNTHESASGDALQVSHTSPPKTNKKRVRFLADLLEEQGVEFPERTDESTAEKSAEVSLTKEGVDGNKEIPAIDEPHVISSIEEKIRMDIDDLLEENIEFWLRFSTSVHQIKKFQNSFQDLQAELKKAMGKRKKRDESSNTLNSSDSDLRAIYRHLREIETELTLWTEHNGVLRDDLQNRLLSLCNIQEEITRLSDCGDPLAKTELSDYQAAKFQGEVMNMKQENNKVSSELLAGLDRGKRLKVDIEKTMEKLDEELGISMTKNPQMKNNVNRAKIPLRSFLFGVKLKKQKPSFFACISPQLQRQYSDLSTMPM